MGDDISDPKATVAAHKRATDNASAVIARNVGRVGC